MLRVAALSMALVLPVSALACGGSKTTTADASDTKAEVAAATDVDAASCAKNAELVGKACSYSTGMMAQRVIAEGNSWTFAGTLRDSSNELASHVAAPFVVGPDSVNVVANEVLESIKTAGLDGSRLSLEGKMLEVDGIKYFVLVGFKALNA